MFPAKDFFGRKIVHQKVKYDTEYKEKYLFSLNLDYKQYLKIGIRQQIDEKIRKIFKEKGYSLSEDAEITNYKGYKEEGWEIIDWKNMKEKYKIKITEKGLDIYSEIFYDYRGFEIIKVVRTKPNDKIKPSQITDEGGWIYSPDSGDIRINCSHKDSKGVPYYEW